MANATIRVDNLTATVTLDVAIAALADENIQLTGRTENGATGVTFTISGADTNWTLTFAVPATSEGSFEIRIVGMVTQTASGSTPEGVMSNSVIVHYDTTAGVTATLGTVDYREGGVIAVPVTFGENVIAPSKSIFEIKHISGDALTDIAYRLIGSGTAFALIFEIPPDRKGSFEIGAKGDVFKMSSGVWDNLSIATKTVNYNTIVPVLKDFDIPANYTPGQKFDVILEFNVPVTFISPQERFGSDDATFLDHFIFEGADLGTPNIYVSSNNTFPTLPIPAFPNPPVPPDDSNWSQLSASSSESKIYLIRYDAVNENATGVFNLTLREGSVRGPVS